ncbi:hypothetical protein KUTeg_001324 [Tegillarca granosa]|uniref:Uncharacterized protein n=1 Tax=Tegillarca granosa TaxID=220873 RepID=A0ABQ9FV53_TEGGR|nr:hypothetical protein KUTeg_001324 [Tegillarca granosa]
MVGSTYISDPDTWKTFYHNMINGKFKRGKSNQVGGGIGGMYSNKPYMIPISQYKSETIQKPLPMIGNEVSPIAAIEERAKSEFKDAIKDEAPRVPIKSRKRKRNISPRKTVKQATSKKRKKQYRKSNKKRWSCLISLISILTCTMSTQNWWETRSLLRFQSPATILMSGPTMSGKTRLTFKILQNARGMFQIPPTQMIIAYGHHQPLFEEMEQSIENLILHHGLPTREDLDHWSESSKHTLLVIDDLINKVVDSEDALFLFCVAAHHKNITVILLTQNLYMPGNDVHSHDMSRLVKTHLAFLELLNTASVKQRVAILKTITDAQLQVICEICLNIYKGKLELTQKYVKQLFPYQRFIETIISKRISKKVKVKSLVRHQRAILKLLSPLLKRYRNGGRTDINTKSKISKVNALDDSGPNQTYADLRTIDDDFQST